MKPQMVKCDECGREFPMTDRFVEVRLVHSLRVRQIEDDDMPIHNEPIALTAYDFCNYQCAIKWMERESFRKNHAIQVSTIRAAEQAGG